MILRHYLPKLRNGFPPPWSSVLWRPSGTKRRKKDRLDFSEIDEIDDCLWIESRDVEELTVCVGESEQEGDFRVEEVRR